MVTPLVLGGRLAVGSLLLLFSNANLLWAIARFSGKISIWSVSSALLLTGILLNALYRVMIPL